MARGQWRPSGAGDRDGTPSLISKKMFASPSPRLFCRSLDHGKPPTQGAIRNETVCRRVGIGSEMKRELADERLRR
jgi:hypothetical protein